ELPAQHQKSHTALCWGVLPWPHPGTLDPLHRLIGELCARRIPANHEHQDRFLVRIAFGDILEAADHARRKRNDIERAEINVFHLTLFAFPARAPGAGHRDERLVGIVIVHLWPMAGLCLAVTEVESLAYLDGGKLGRVVPHRRGHRSSGAFGQLKANHVEQRPLAAGHFAVGQAAIEALEVPEARYALHHLVAREINSRKLLHDVLLISVLRARPKTGHRWPASYPA